MTWRYREKPQPDGAKFKVPAVDAPNVNGARMFGLAGRRASATRRANRTSPRCGRRSRPAAWRRLYVFDPGPEGSIGDTQWIVEARKSGAIGLLIVQGVLLTELARAADFVLPGASYVEKEASYTNQQGRLQGTSRAIPLPGEAQGRLADPREPRQRRSACRSTYQSAADVRADIVARFAGRCAGCRD